ncbi:phosphoribosylamine--glycine ligase [Candidatus Marinamargulisbacteria bacterium SCGC AAA071-K20]|nr:phosphoribosylamine--glycine ligase [Candidatus Marinamargulisbacteria bacterium SCGC AAA071-K20]
MNILIIGSGGREHALGVALKKSPQCEQLYFAPGNAGTSTIGKNLSISDIDIDALLDFATQNKIDLTMVGPEAPLVSGIVDIFTEAGLAIVGPSKAAAQLEGSKDWAKAFMVRHNIPTAKYETFLDYDTSIAYINKRDTYPIVIKADGLAAGKGVTVALNFEMADDALTDCFIDQKFSEAGAKVVIEDFLKGEEASIFAFTDGHVIKPMTPAQDHKAVFDGDKGPNTGGMGSYSPAPLVTPAIEDNVYNDVFLPLLRGLQAEGIVYKGIVYAGLMIDKGEVSIVEFNVRFGDPETQVVLPRLKTDLVTILNAVSNETLDSVNLEWSDDSGVCVVLASGGYPGSYKKGQVMTGLEGDTQTCYVIHAGSEVNDKDETITKGGRVCGVVSIHSDLKIAIETAYQRVDQVQFNGKYNRTDIGFKAFKSIKS